MIPALADVDPNCQTPTWALVPPRMQQKVTAATHWKPSGISNATGVSMRWAGGQCFHVSSDFWWRVGEVALLPLSCVRMYVR